MNTPTKAQRNKIDSAIDKVASLCTEDPTLTPSEAIAKVAFDRNTTNTTSLVLLLEKIQTDFNSEDKVTIFNQLEDLLHSMSSITPTQL